MNRKKARFWIENWLGESSLLQSSVQPIRDDVLNATIRDYWHDERGWK